MPAQPKGRRVLLSNVPPGLWARCKAEAALAGRTVNDWVIEALIAKAEDAIDIREAKAALEEPGDSIPWEQIREEILGPRRRAV